MKKKNNPILLPSLVKNKALVQLRRKQIIEASILLFIKNGFHKTTTRQIAQASDISTGSLYEYIKSKEDVLFLVCNSIHKKIEKKVDQAMNSIPKGKKGLNEIIKQYFQVCYQMQDHILLIYQETKSLPKKWREKVLTNETKVTDIFKKSILELIRLEIMPPIKPKQLDIITHNIAVLGHMLTFRRWFINDNYSIDDYIIIQTQNILGMYFASSKEKS